MEPPFSRYFGLKNPGRSIACDDRQRSALVRDIAEFEEKLRELDTSEESPVASAISFLSQLLKDKRSEPATLRYLHEAR
jgi:hypothetical protein